MSSKLENRSQKILVVDDDPQSLKISKAALEHEGYSVRTVDSGEEALTEFSNYQPHLILLDMSMPGLNGIETLRKIRDIERYTAVIFLSGKSGTEHVITGLEAGANDYIRKPYDVAELIARVRTQLRIKDLNDRLKVANDRLKELVDIDDLTGLFNMRSLYKKLDFEIERARRYERSLGVIMMDLDHFKQVNDANDHLFGSFVLAEVGKMIRANMRKVDFAARYGGDEYLIVLTEINREGTQTFCERLCAAISSHVFEKDQFKIKLTASLGFAVASPAEEEVDARNLVRKADRALYQAKDQGRNRVVGS
ncbi:MAG TPA: diguanylate cyclase response regulator [Bdellovibrionales bacterium]|nr:diguanylate cyclase response regulator [Bdellovibrionales bacterium]